MSYKMVVLLGKDSALCWWHAQIVKMKVLDKRSSFIKFICQS